MAADFVVGTNGRAEPLKKEQKRPEVVGDGKYRRISTCAFVVNLVADHLIMEARHSWYNLGDLARFVYGRNAPGNVKKCRGPMWHVRRELIKRGFILLHRGRPYYELKIYDQDNKDEWDMALSMVCSMRNRTEISAEIYAKAERLVLGE